MVNTRNVAKETLHRIDAKRRAVVPLPDASYINRIRTTATIRASKETARAGRAARAHWTSYDVRTVNARIEGYIVALIIARDASDIRDEV